MRPRRWFAILVCLCCLVTAAWPAEVKGENKKKERLAVVTVDRVNVRQGPGVPYRPLANVHRGETYRLIDIKDGWLKIEWKKNKIGWIAASYAAPVREMEIVQEDRLRLRQEPGLDGRIIGHLAQGDQVIVIKEKGEWKQIVTKKAVGWVAASYLADAESPTGSRQTGVVTADSLNVRVAPSLDAERIGRLLHGERVEIVETKRDWYKIVTRSGLGGWVAAEYIEMKNGQAVGNQEEAVAESASPAAVDLVTIQENGPRQYVKKWTRTPVQVLAGKTIVLDAGHGGKDGGAESVNGVTEKTLTMETAERLKEKLETYGARVVLTRVNDDYVPLSARVATARLYQADAFISLHYDSAEDEDASGITAYYYDRFADYGLAQSFQGPFSKLSALPFRGLAFGNYYVLRENERPSVLLELGYLSNRSDAEVVATDSYQETVTTAIVNAVRHYFQ
ncbi:N-acetylmuramoyl-L-alanine amidase [Geobacillus sp. 47C-IIb]|uniref:N-acetylmuramoyl-L-alanine amidase n=1 Tax=Geobacillus TaxID=129337 RepID=UPI0009BC988B|nr:MULTISPECIES: N-acetylmuramoyl-L-alanine amidase [Geobacillus]ATO37738.1 N-acetylmuramoyl-L-alanine amidase [Geobacillus thermodenitrificans]OQP09897.1 N-acetylmuramoyl-L-alanine amidase [Geobacillus sp. 47C-IIb]QNU32683.1 N-acetylmuramoyl-L-alanine amidase [Geobacillus sp. 47C-IIb]